MKTVHFLLLITASGGRQIARAQEHDAEKEPTRQFVRMAAAFEEETERRP